jgi:hypothetical protein
MVIVTIIEKNILKFPTIIVELSISYFSFVSFASSILLIQGWWSGSSGKSTCPASTRP